MHQEDEEKAKRLLQRESERQLWFQNEVNNRLQIPNGYLKVALLIIRWDEKIDDLAGHTEEVTHTCQISRLRAICEKRFYFECDVVELENVRDPQLDLNWYILGHIRKHDGPNNLLMIYYTGHGSKFTTENGGERLELAATRTWIPTSQTRTPIALWHEAESPLLERAEGDVLSILDCCFASSAANKSRNQEMRNYQLLAASASGRLTKGPGDKSFTKALCDSMEELLDASGEGGSFTVIELYERINTKRKTQAALVWEPLKRYNRSIRLAPLKVPTNDRKDSFQLRDPEKASLALRVSLKEDDMSRTQVETFAQELVQACSNAKVPVRKLEWIKMDIIPEVNHVSIAEIASAKRVVQKYQRRKSNAGAISPVKEVKVPATRKRTRSGAEAESPAGPSRQRTRSNASTLSPNVERSMPSPSPSAESVGDGIASSSAE
ncbi:hypothetical protein BDV96DRAFT_549394 [Lophiotrema nucula]|uniref:Caspase domain-containing protein n=1 Tax=Lophiotrema nucula TaxID=690887 RepID=A0A6A5Z266_9PLEO|nr:hypothetical protein BDV96DRAFT_549394 [Lophiotrema nucula]